MGVFAKSLAMGLLAGILVPTAVQAAPIFASSDSASVIGGRSDGTNFIVGAVGSDGGNNVYTDNVWPAAESPGNVIDGLPAKYLNFAELNSGFITKPSFNGGAGSVAGSIQVWTANDAPERDPTSYQLYGTNNTITGAGPFPLSSFTLISSGALSLPAGRDNAAALDNNNSQTVSFANGASYQTYLVLFPTVSNEPAANSMQVGDVQIFTAVPEPASLGLIGLAGLALIRRRR